MRQVQLTYDDIDQILIIHFFLDYKHLCKWFRKSGLSSEVTKAIEDYLYRGTVPKYDER